jgi:8-oxo-dGTP diphosphatase
VKAWVVGFLFDDDAEQVILVRKNRPEWQAGKLNGVGGKVELGERIYAAMEREFREETGVSFIDKDRAIGIPWQHFLSLTWEQGIVHFFRAFAPRATLDECVTVTDEVIVSCSIRRLLTVGTFRPIPNLLWLVPLAAHRHDSYEVIHVAETGTLLRKTGRDGT